MAASRPAVLALAGTRPAAPVADGETLCPPAARYTWLIVAAVLLLDAAWIALGDFGLAWANVGWAALVLATALAGLAAARRLGVDASILALTESIAQLLAVPILFGPLSYLSASLGAPLRDELLDALDRALGFDWPSFNAWAQAHAAVGWVLGLAYDSVLWQILVLLLVMSYRHPERVPVHRNETRLCA